MSIAPLVKSLVEKIPYPVGTCIARVPYGLRLGMGTIYRKRNFELTAFDEMSVDERSHFVFLRMEAIVKHAFTHVDFYRQHYQKHGFDPSQLGSFDDLPKIPIINKSLLREYSLDARSCPQSGRYLVNTGGSSGSPLSFYILPSSMGHEWAHMHHIWAKLGYRQHDLKLCFAGRDIKNEAVCYDALRHHYAVNIYRSNEDISRSLKKILEVRDIRYLHGYPSALYDFACYCESQDQELATLLRAKLKGAFLGSEFPTPVYRNKIESVFGIPSVSWYGHTERAVLAWEKNAAFVYHPFQSYGFAEAVQNPETQTTRLVGTSYYNTASPLIRYDTGDEVEVVSEVGDILESFRIAGGREGDYVIDAKGKRISLTGLVFGRHHKMFDRAKFIQVSQDEPGKMTFLITPNGQSVPESELPALFDLAGIDMGFDFVQIREPMLSPSGKVGLRVKGIDFRP